VLAADVSAGQAQVLSQKITQQQPWFDVALMFNSIDPDVDDHAVRAD
jgi:hypothetical protein